MTNSDAQAILGGTATELFNFDPALVAAPIISA
jgi:hypothetical protein